MTDDRIDPTPEQLRKSVYERVKTSDIDPSEQEITTALRNRGVTSLDRWHTKGIIDDRQHAAGQWFQAVWIRAGLNPSLTQDLLRVGGAGQPNYGMAVSEAQAHNRQLYRAAISAVGTRLSPILLNAVVFDYSATQIGKDCGEKDKRRAQAVGTDRIRLALDMLDDFLQELSRAKQRNR